MKVYRIRCALLLLPPTLPATFSYFPIQQSQQAGLRLKESVDKK